MLGYPPSCLPGGTDKPAGDTEQPRADSRAGGHPPTIIKQEAPCN